MRQKTDRGGGAGVREYEKETKKGMGSDRDTASEGDTEQSLRETVVVQPD